MYIKKEVHMYFCHNTIPTKCLSTLESFVEERKQELNFGAAARLHTAVAIEARLCGRESYPPSLGKRPFAIVAGVMEFRKNSSLELAHV